MFVFLRYLCSLLIFLSPHKTDFKGSEQKTIKVLKKPTDSRKNMIRHHNIESQSGY